MSRSGDVAAEWEPVGDPDVASVAALFADAARVEMLKALLDGRTLPASDLARAAGIARSTASGHLDRLVEARVLEVRRQGRYAYFRLAGSAAPAALEALAAVAALVPGRSPVSAHGRRHAAGLARARTCYDHLAGRAGVAVADALRRRGLVVESSTGDLSVDVRRWDEDPPLEVRCATLDRGRRPLVRTCLDWSERRPHLGGAIGAALTRRLFELDWLRRSPGQARVVVITPAGVSGLRRHLDVDDVRD